MVLRIILKNLIYHDYIKRTLIRIIYNFIKIQLINTKSYKNNFYSSINLMVKFLSFKSKYILYFLFVTQYFLKKSEFKIYNKINL